MKNAIKLITALMFFININTSLADDLKYKLYVTNINYISEKTLEFDIYLMKLMNDKEELKYGFGMYILNINPGFANSGILTYTLMNSDLPGPMRPSGASVSENQLILSINNIDPDFESFPVIPYEEPGLLIAKMKLETSSDKFSKEDFDLEWSNGENNLNTRIATFVDDKTVEVRDFRNYFFSSNDQGFSGGLSSRPSKFSLSQNSPNPFNPSTFISYSLTEDAFTSLRVYDINGKIVATLVNEDLDAGEYEVGFNGGNFASGIYYYKIISGKYTAGKRMFLIK
jgi:hypothetical protein